MARDCHDDGVALAVFPELTLSGYSIEDILLQDALLDAVEDALLDIIAASADLLPVLVVGAPLRYQHRIYNTAVVIHRGTCWASRPSPICRPTASSTSAARWPPVTMCAASSGWVGRARSRRCRSAPICCSPRRTCPASCCTSRSARTCSCRYRRAREAALAGATVLANLSGSPITIGRAEDRALLARSASSRCLAAYVYAAAGEGESTTDLAWDGQTMVWENGVLPGPVGAVSQGAHGGRSPMSTWSCCGPSGSGWARSTTTAVHHDIAAESFRRIEFELDPPAGDIGLRREVERFPFVPSDPARLEQDCYEAYNIQVAGSRAAAAGAELPEGGDRCVRRSGLHPRADRRRPRDGSGRPAAQRHSGVHAARVSPPASAPRTMRSGSARRWE